MFETNFGIEIELTGITRAKAAKVIAKELHATTVTARKMSNSPCVAGVRKCSNSTSQALRH